MWGIQKDTVYELRVMGYSRGGDGKMSHASFFTLGIMFFIHFLTIPTGLFDNGFK